MCNHHFVFPNDNPENYNSDGQTLSGRCKCGATQNAYGMRWMINREDNFLEQVPYGETQNEFVDKLCRMC
jgi:hypothetical protein